MATRPAVAEEGVGALFFGAFLSRSPPHSRSTSGRGKSRNRARTVVQPVKKRHGPQSVRRAASPLSHSEAVTHRQNIAHTERNTWTETQKRRKQCRTLHRESRMVTRTRRGAWRAHAVQTNTAESRRSASQPAVTTAAAKAALLPSARNVGGTLRRRARVTDSPKFGPRPAAGAERPAWRAEHQRDVSRDVTAHVLLGGLT